MKSRGSGTLKKRNPWKVGEIYCNCPGAYGKLYYWMNHTLYCKIYPVFTFTKITFAFRIKIFSVECEITTGHFSRKIVFKRGPVNQKMGPLKRDHLRGTRGLLYTVVPGWSRSSGPTFGGPGSPSSGPVLVVPLLVVPGPRQVVPFGWSRSRVPGSRVPQFRYAKCIIYMF